MAAAAFVVAAAAAMLVSIGIIVLVVSHGMMGLVQRVPLTMPVLLLTVTLRLVFQRRSSPTLNSSTPASQRPNCFAPTSYSLPAASTSSSTIRQRSETPSLCTTSLTPRSHYRLCLPYCLQWYNSAGALMGVVHRVDRGTSPPLFEVGGRNVFCPPPLFGATNIYYV